MVLTKQITICDVSQSTFKWNQHVHGDTHLYKPFKLNIES